MLDYKLQGKNMLAKDQKWVLNFHCVFVVLSFETLVRFVVTGTVEFARDVSHCIFHTWTPLSSLLRTLCCKHRQRGKWWTSAAEVYGGWNAAHVCNAISAVQKFSDENFWNTNFVILFLKATLKNLWGMSSIAFRLGNGHAPIRMIACTVYT